VFLSFRPSVTATATAIPGFTANTGCGPRQTLGFELGHSNAGESSVMIWWQRALDDGEGPNRFDLLVGDRVLERDGKLVPWRRSAPHGAGALTACRCCAMCRAAVGWPSMRAPSWPSEEEEPDRTPDANGRWSSRQVYLTPKTTVKAEVTLGWNASSSLMLINQLRLEDRDDTGLFGQAGEFGGARSGGPAKIELGVIMPLSGEGEHA
jgi:hypothetical protein